MFHGRKAAGQAVWESHRGETDIQALEWFSIVVCKLLERASCTSVEALKARVLAFIKYFNTTMA